MSIAEKFPLHLYNSLGREKTLFEAINAPNVGMYVCGPTVYDDPHLGHARAAITYDVVYRYLTALGYKVRYVRNITDVGHLENEEEDSGEDKISKRARLESLEPMEIVQKYTNNYHKNIDELNCLPPSIEPRATGHIIEQIEAVKSAIDNGFAYEVNGSVYFDLPKYMESNHYGELSGKVLEDLQVGTRDTKGLDEKRSPSDFALWKKAKAEHIMHWPSPWGEGFPGWHIECTAMSCKYLGVPFDIHGGGMDLQFPHHECEIAQSVGSYGKKPVNYWMHNNMLTIDGAKMSKSAGNFITLDQLFAGEHELLEQAYSPMTIRFFTLQAHYRSPVDFSNRALQAAETGYQRLISSVDMIHALTVDGKSVNDALEKELNDLCDDCWRYMSDDFNTAQTIAALFEIVNRMNAIANEQSDGSISEALLTRVQETVQLFVDGILGLRSELASDNSKLDGIMQLLISLRKDARDNKDFDTSDKIRDGLNELGIELKDGRNGGTDYSL